MATKYTLSAYGIRIKERNKRGSERYRNLSCFSSSLDFFNVIPRCFESIDHRQDGGISHYEDDKVMRLKSFNIIGRRCCGMIEAGTYGTRQDIVNADTGETEGVKQKNHSLTKHFYFRFYIPENSTLGILIVENIGGSGIVSMLKECLLSYCNGLQLNDNICLELNPLSAQEIIDRWTQSQASSQITLIGVKSDTVNVGKMTGIDVGEANIKTSVSFKVSKKGEKVSIGKLFCKAKNNKNMFVLENGNECDDIQFEMELNGVSHKFTMNNISHIGAKLEITPELESNGFPSFETLHREANTYEAYFQEILDSCQLNEE